LGADDLAIAATQLRSTMAAPSILVGHSLHGAAAPSAHPRQRLCQLRNEDRPAGPD
jgi:hypothetical protein